MKPLLLLAALCLFFATEALAQTQKPTTANANKTVVEIVANSPDHTMLLEAVKAAGLTETLKGKGPFTIFAPTNSAFEKMDADRGQMPMNPPVRRDNMKMKRDTIGMSRDSSIWNRMQRDTSNTWDRTRVHRDTTARSRNRTSRDTSNTWDRDPGWTQRQRDTTATWDRPRTSRDTSNNWDRDRGWIERDTVNNQDQSSIRVDSMHHTRNNDWMKPENRMGLKNILTYHVVRGNYDAQALQKAIKAGNGKAELTTINGAKLIATMQGNTIQIEDVAGHKAQVTTADLKGSNGVIHVIDTIVMPTNDKNKK